MVSRGTAATPDAILEAYAETTGGILRVAESLDPAGWVTPTGCPGWTVRDCVAHVADVERRQLGDSAPEHTLPAGLPHVTDEVKRFMELGVDRRRRWSVDDLLDDLRGATAARRAALATLTPADLEIESPGLFGRAPLRRLLGLRIFDIWSHEQDIRRALGRPGGLDGVAGAHAREQLVAGVAGSVQRGLAPAAGTTVLLEVTGDGSARRGLGFDGASGRRTDAPDDPTVTLRMDLSTLAVLGCGRHDVPDAATRVEVGGDATLGRQMLEHFGFTP